MYKRLRILFPFLLIFLILFANTAQTLAAGSSKTISISVNSVTVKFNGKIAKIDSFNYSGLIFVQPQDVSNQLNIDYTYDAKTKTINISNNKPSKLTVIAKSKFSTVKSGTAKKIAVAVNSVIIKVNGKALNSENYSYNGTVYASAKDISGLLQKDYLLDSKAKTLNINNKKVQEPVTPVTPPVVIEEKPPVPSLAADVTQKTKGNVTVTISNWGNAVTEEYNIDNGAWQPYTAPVVIATNCTINARGTNKSGAASDTGILKVDNILKLLSKTEVSDLRNTVVKVIICDINHTEMGNGSGFIVSSDGKVVTNYHVIDMAPIIEVQTADKTTYQVSGVLKYSVSEDIAILQLKDASNLPTVSLGNSDELKYGEDIAAMGHPLGMSLTVTFGNISSLDSPGGLARKAYSDIQFSAPISAGNSGGPLVNMYGQVVGINYSGIDAGQNLNYAIPINELTPMLDGLGTAESFTDVIKEVYPNMNYAEYSMYLYMNYPIFSSNGYNFNFNNIDVMEYSKDPNEVDVYVNLNNDNFAEILRAEAQGGKAEVENWIADIYKTVKVQYPNKDVYVLISNTKYFSSKPSGYSDDQLFQDSSTGEWEAIIPTLVYTVHNNAPAIKWLN